LASYARDRADEISPIENIKSDDWVEYKNSNFTTVGFGSMEWRDRAGEVNNAVVGEMLETKAPSIIIATDRSVRENTTAWGGVLWRDGRSVFEWSTGRHVRSSSYRSECEAMEDAFIWLSINSTATDHVVILTYSLSLVSKLQSGRVKKVWLLMLDTISAHTAIIYIPGHAGIHFNERADKLEVEAEAFGYLELTGGDILRVLTEAMRKRRRVHSPWLDCERKRLCAVKERM
jgi:ribonuclease HI